MVFKLRMSWSELRLNIFSWKRICSQKWESRCGLGNRKESNVTERKFKNYFDDHFKFSFLKILYPCSSLWSCIGLAKKFEFSVWRYRKTWTNFWPTQYHILLIIHLLMDVLIFSTFWKMCEWCCYEHSCTRVCLNICFLFFSFKLFTISLGVCLGVKLLGHYYILIKRILFSKCVACNFLWLPIVLPSII